MRHEHKVHIDKDRCSACGLCIKDCVSNAIRMTENGAEFSSTRCIACAHCFAICPEKAVCISGFEDTSEEVTPERRVDSNLLLYQLKARRSMRHFTQQEVAPELISRIIEAGQYTPTASNKQDVSYVVIRDNLAEYETLGLSFMRTASRFVNVFSRKYRHIKPGNHFLFKGAPVVIVIKASELVDGALAASSMEMMAQSLGLGVLYSGFFTIAARFSRKLKRKLHVGPGEKIVATLVIGHPAIKYQRTAPKEQPVVLYD